MIKRMGKCPSLSPVIVNLNGIFYALMVTRSRTMLRLLSFCDNGKGGKTRLVITAPVNLVGPVGEKDFERYIFSAEKNWAIYKPMRFKKFEDAKDALSKKVGVEYDLVSFHSFGKFL